MSVEIDNEKIEEFVVCSMRRKFLKKQHIFLFKRNMVEEIGHLKPLFRLIDNGCFDFFSH